MERTDISRIVENNNQGVRLMQINNVPRDNRENTSRQISCANYSVLEIVRSYPIAQKNYSSELSPDDFLITSEMDYYKENRAYQK